MLKVASSLFSFVQEGHEEHAESGSEFIMGHVLDHVIYEIHLFGFDLSITKHVVMMWIASAILVALFATIFRKPKLIPHGLANAFESILVFLDEDVLKPYLGSHSRQYAPYLFTAFFFILLCNYLGLVPGGATATGDISVTATLAVATFLIGIGAGIKNHGLGGFMKSFVPPGLPVIMLPLMIPVEIIGLVSKHFTLAMRLFANMVAGHIVMFTFLSIIFMFKSYAVGVITLGGMFAVGLLEVLIALLQAYIFTTLSAVYIGLAIHQDH